MYKVNDVIVYGNNEVCRIEKIAIPDFIETNDEYYYLKPLSNPTSIIYVKTNTQKPMRSILSKENAEELLRELSSTDALYDKNDKIREKEFHDIIRSCDCEQLLRMLKGISLKKEQKESTGKRLSLDDEKYYNKVESCLSLEFSQIFHISVDQAKKQIMHAM